MPFRARASVPVVVFALLVAATALMFWSGEHRWLGRRGAAVFLLTIAFVKVRLVMQHFMGLKTAPTGWRLLFDAWCVSALALLALLWRS